ncbi:MAG: YebC/PmpR family DNA-binding transcriptional regulator, partial [Patescibacteria group bacterium]
AKRASAFTRVAHLVTLAAREKGGNPETNFSLRLAIERARAANMPKDNIERAIKRGTGELSGETLEEITYEGFGPGGVALIIHTLTDNRNRSVSEIKHALSKHGGNLGAANSVLWMFERRGTLGIDSASCTEERELAFIERGAEDIIKDEDGITIVTAPDSFQSVKEYLEQEGIAPAFAEVGLVPKERTSLPPEEQERIDKLVEVLEDMADVVEVSTNVA